MDMTFTAQPETEIGFADLGYRAVLATIAAAQAGTPTARAAATLARTPAAPVSPLAALVDMLRPTSAARPDVRPLHGSFHPATASRIGIDPETSVKAAFTFAFQPSFNASDIDSQASDTIRHR
jgi:hypothetical protein